MLNVKTPHTIPAYCVNFFDAIFISLILSVLLLGLFTPLLDALGHVQAGTAIRKFLAFTCHQIPSHCIQFFGQPMGICARCTAIYCGIFITRLFLHIDRQGFIQVSPSMLWRLNSPIFVFLLLFQMILEWSLNNNGLLNDSMARRFISGFLFGVGWIFGPHLYVTRWIRLMSEKWIIHLLPLKK